MFINSVNNSPALTCLAMALLREGINNLWLCEKKGPRLTDLTDVHYEVIAATRRPEMLDHQNRVEMNHYRTTQHSGPWLQRFCKIRNCEKGSSRHNTFLFFVGLGGFVRNGELGNKKGMSNHLLKFE